MSLAKFVLENRRKILDGWDQFAVTMPGAEELDQAALRASAIRLWSATEPTTDPDRLAELTRFNEGIDQAITESAQRFSSKVGRSRELFMGILGHDLRTPLHIVLSSADKLMKPSQTPEDQLRLATYIHDAAQSINRLVNDLLDVARTRLGGVSYHSSSNSLTASRCAST